MLTSSFCEHGWDLFLIAQHKNSKKDTFYRKILENAPSYLLCVEMLKVDIFTAQKSKGRCFSSLSVKIGLFLIALHRNTKQLVDLFKN